MITAFAPASSAIMLLAKKLQSPLSTNAILPFNSFAFLTIWQPWGGSVGTKGIFSSKKLAF